MSALRGLSALLVLFFFGSAAGVEDNVVSLDIIGSVDLAGCVASTGFADCCVAGFSLFFLTMSLNDLDGSECLDHPLDCELVAGSGAVCVVEELFILYGTYDVSLVASGAV